MEPSEIAEYRLMNLQISAHPYTDPVDIVSSIGAMQAQDYNGGLWGIGLRMQQGKRRDVEGAIAAKSVVRTWPMRGTLHFVSHKDVRWMLSLLPEEENIPRYMRDRGLTEPVLREGKRSVVSALKQKAQMTRPELCSVLSRSGMPELRQGEIQRHILRRAARDSLVCYGSHRGKQATFALLDEWVPSGKAIGRKEALRELALRYFSSHGPATMRDFCWWSGLRVSDARIALEGASSKLMKSESDDKTYWMPRPKKARNLGGRAYLISTFDEYILGYTDRSAVLRKDYASRIVPGGNGMFLSTILLDGMVVGTWKGLVGKREISIATVPFRKFTASEKNAINEAAGRYGEFMGLPVRKPS